MKIAIKSNWAVKKYFVSINANQKSKNDVLTYYGTLADYEIVADGDNKARENVFEIFCQEFPDRSHNINDYTISVGLSND